MVNHAMNASHGLTVAHTIPVTNQNEAVVATLLVQAEALMALVQQQALANRIELLALHIMNSGKNSVSSDLIQRLTDRVFEPVGESDHDDRFVR